MQEIRRASRREVAWLGVRARAPQFVRLLAVALFAAGCVVIGVNYYRSRGVKQFRMIPGPAELSTNVVRRVENYERRVTEGERLTMYVRAAVATSFDDGHHELTQVHIEYYPEDSQQPHKIDSQQAVYFNETELVNFSGNVQIESADRLKVASESVSYEVKGERAESKVPLTFSRDNVSGRADSAVVEGKQKRLHLAGNVEVRVDPAAAKPGEAAPQLSARDKPVTVRAPRADYDHARHHLTFTGGATAEQDADVMSGETLSGFLNERQRLQRIEARRNSYLRSSETGRAAEVRSTDMDFFFDANQRLERAVASGGAQARTLDADSAVELTTPTAVQVFFAAQADRSVIRELRAEGRPVVTMAAPRSKANDPAAASKRLTADSIKLFWRAGVGRDLEKAEAVGNAELIVEPVQQLPSADRKQLNAPRFDCDFHEGGNLARLFTATGGARAVVTPVVPDQKRGVSTLTSKTMLAHFARETQDVERVESQGETVFNEGDRNGQSENGEYTIKDSTVRLRGGEPLAWDSRARLKAAEIDSNVQTKITYARGRVQTTYYSQEQTGGATPFSKVKSPVFVNSNEAEFHHESGVGIYTGEARAWQDDNFVRGDRITVRRAEQRMDAEGRVQSALYRAQRKDANGNRQIVPVFATSTRMFYSNPERLIRYEGSVDIKQGTERITSEQADVILQKDQNEVERTIAQRNVVVTQPGKRGTGERAEYVAADETVQLTGDPARVVDDEKGTSESRRITVFLRENRVVSDTAATPGGRPTGRVRSVHKVKKQGNE
jgi:LPS export ABC transporter protein LptC/lipopolysaccharide transport protein LptA